MKSKLLLLTTITLLNQQVYAAGAAREADPGSKPMDGGYAAGKRVAVILDQKTDPSRLRFKHNWCGNPTSETEEMDDAAIQEIIAHYARESSSMHENGISDEYRIKWLNTEIRYFPTGSILHSHINMLIGLIQSKRG